MLLVALMLSGVFFFFFGNGSSPDHSLFSWIKSTFSSVSFEALFCLMGLGVYFIYSKKFRHEVLLGRVSFGMGRILIALAIGVAVWAFFAGYPAFSFLAFTALVFGIIVAFHGRGADVYVLILLLSFFALPASPVEPLDPFLQLATVKLLRLLLSVFGVDFSSHGTQMIIQEYAFRIAEACSGRRSIELGVKFSIFISIVYPVGWQRRLLFIGLSVLAGVFSNLVRLAVVFSFGVWKGYEFAETIGHEVVGPILGVSILLTFFLLSLPCLAKRVQKRKKAYCEQRTDRYAPRLFVFTAACLCLASVVCAVFAAPFNPLPQGDEFKQITELEAVGSWKRMDDFYCDSPECLLSLKTKILKPTGPFQSCAFCKEELSAATPSSLCIDEEESLEVFRTRYRNPKTDKEIAVAIVRGGRSGLSICSPAFHLRSIDARLGPGLCEKLDISEARVQIQHLSFGWDASDGKASSFSGICWYVLGDKISGHRFRLKTAFQHFDKDEWVCLVYCKQYDGSDADLSGFVRQLFENALLPAMRDAR